MSASKEEELGETACAAEPEAGKTSKVRRKKRALTINLTNCKYDSVRRVARRFGLRPVGEDEEWTLYWTDTSVLLERVMNMKRYQKINHFPGMLEICRKDLLARNMTRMLKLFPREYNCFPRTWVMPADYGDFQAYCRAKKNKTFIVKPDSGSQGKGIFVFKNPKEIKPGQHLVCQQYISRPFLIDGFKFDFRIYVLLTSCDPLRIYVYKDGLGRFATVQYREPVPGNMSDICMHLTNYAINKFSDNFVRDDDSGSKRRITTVNQWFRDNGYDIDKIWHDIDDVIIKTVVSIHPILKHNYRSCFPNHNRGSACFEILGFDLLLDRKLKPWLLEVNHSPSFHTDAPLDKEVKEGLLHDTLNLIDFYSNDKRRCTEEDKRKVKERLLRQPKDKEAASHADEDARAKYETYLESYEKTHRGGFRRIYPNGNKEYYSKFFDQSTSLCTETAASKARVELSRQLREEIEAKQKELQSYRQKLGVSTGEAKSKRDAPRPESPGGERRKAGQSVSILRRTSFRLPTYLTRPQRKAEPKPSVASEESIVPYGDDVAPLLIHDEEELERLAGLQLRDNLIRGLGVSEHLHAIIDTRAGDSDPTRTLSRSQTHRPESSASMAGTRPTSVFVTRTRYQDSAVGTSFSQSSFPSEHPAPFITDTAPHRRLSAQSLGRTPGRPANPGPTHFVLGYRSRFGRAGNEPPHHHLNRPQRHPPQLQPHPQHFGLSIISAPAHLISRTPQDITTGRHLGAPRPVWYYQYDQLPSAIYVSRIGRDKAAQRVTVGQSKHSGVSLNPPLYQHSQLLLHPSLGL